MNVKALFALFLILFIVPSIYAAEPVHMLNSQENCFIALAELAINANVADFGPDLTSGHLTLNKFMVTSSPLSYKITIFANQTDYKNDLLKPGSPTRDYSGTFGRAYEFGNKASFYDPKYSFGSESRLRMQEHQYSIFVDYGKLGFESCGVTEIKPLGSEQIDIKNMDVSYKGSIVKKIEHGQWSKNYTVKGKIIPLTFDYVVLEREYVSIDSSKPVARQTILTVTDHQIPSAQSRLREQYHFFAGKKDSQMLATYTTLFHYGLLTLGALLIFLLVFAIVKRIRN